ncbi:MAG: reverse transcriptase [Bacteroidaceae bacterium]|nr:reverse transcriptase [Bacteroidaceae bacterium]
MKRIGNLYDKIISVDNLRLADTKARRGKTHAYGVKLHDRNREANIIALHEALLTRTFKTSPYEVFTIFEPKEREIFRLPYYPDRIVHHAIMNVLEPLWVSVFTHNTFSCIKGRGIEGCARSARKHIRKYAGRPLYCLKIDIRKYYPSIDHNTLKAIIRRKIKDERLLWLLDEIIDSAPGLPIGNYLSQYLANLYLAPLMHKVNEEWRIDADEYADDIVFYSDSKEKLREAFHTKIKPFIEEDLKLQVKGNYQIFPVAKNREDKHGRALDFVGYKFYREQQLIRKSIMHNFCRAVARLNKKTPTPSLIDYKMGICSWLGWAKHSNSRQLLKIIIKPEYQHGIL